MRGSGEDALVVDGCDVRAGASERDGLTEERRRCCEQGCGTVAEGAAIDPGRAVLGHGGSRLWIAGWPAGGVHRNLKFRRVLEWWDSHRLGGRA